MMENLDMKLCLASSDPAAIYDYVSENNGTFLCFLDIELGKTQNQNGIILSSEIKKINPEVLVVFVTSHGKYMQLTFEYKTGAIGYILKGKPQEQTGKIIEYINYAYEHFGQKPDDKKRLTFNVDEKTMVEIRDDIISFELKRKNLKKVTIYTVNRSYEFFGTLNQVEEMDKMFFRCHRSVVVNINNVSWIDDVNQKVHMINGDICDGSVRAIKELKTLIKK